MCWYSVPPSHHLASVRHRQLVRIILENFVFSDPISHSSHGWGCPALSHSLRREDRLRRDSCERARQLCSASKPAVWPWLSGLTSLSFTFSSCTLWQHWSRQRGRSQTSCLQICFKLLFAFIYLWCACVHGGSWAQHSMSGEDRGQLQEFPPTIWVLGIKRGLGSQ